MMWIFWTPASRLSGRPRPWGSSPCRSRPARSGRGTRRGSDPGSGCSGSLRSRRMPGVSVRKTSFSACSATATAAAAVSALTFRSWPSSSTSSASEGSTGTTPARQRFSIGGVVDLGHLADAAQVDRAAVAVGQRQPPAEEALASSCGAGPTARPPNLLMCRTMSALISSASTRATISSVASSV